MNLAAGCIITLYQGAYYLHNTYILYPFSVLDLLPCIVLSLTRYSKIQLKKLFSLIYFYVLNMNKIIQQMTGTRE
jgi:hypothetical protein